MYAQSEKSAIYYTLGITEHVCGTDNVRSIANLALLTGHIGKPSTGVNPIRGQNNVQGATDMCIPDKLPGYQLFSDQKVVEKFEKAWGVTLNKTPGNTSPTMFERMSKGEFKALYVIGEDPIMSEPNQDYTIKGLKNLELLVVQDIFLSERQNMPMLFCLQRVLLKRTVPLPTRNAVCNVYERVSIPLEIQSQTGRLSVSCPPVWAIRWIIRLQKKCGTKLPALYRCLQVLITQGSSRTVFNGRA